MLDNDDIRDEQVRREYLKYEIRKFTICFSKNLNKELRKETQSLEEKVKRYESSVTTYHKDLQYIEYKERLNTIHSKKVNGIKIRSKCDWYESEEKSTKFFLNLEKSRLSQGVVCSILKNKTEVKNQLEINNELYKFYKNLFKENLNTSKEDIFSFLENINLPRLTEQALECEGIISETELLKALKSMKNGKSPKWKHKRVL